MQIGPHCLPRLIKREAGPFCPGVKGMFDAKSLFEMMVQGGNQRPAAAAQPQNGMPDLGDLLRQFTEGGNQGGQNAGGQSSQSGGAGGGSNALEDLMRQFSPDKLGNGDRTRNEAGGTAPSGSSGGNPLEDLLRQFTQQQGNQTSSGQAPAGHMRELPDASSPGSSGTGSTGTGGGGGFGDLLGEVLGQGRDAAGKAGESTQDALRDMLQKIGGNNADAGQLVKQLSDFIGNNKLGAGAALGGLGALIFGTQTGRSIAMSAAKIGALAVVGGLAYKAYQNYSQGRPMGSGSSEPEAAPAGTGFEADEVSNDAAITYIRGMIAAAAADGRIDATEQSQIIDTLSQQGLDAAAEEFLARELNNPASIDDLVDGVANQTEALQLYTATRVAVEPDTAAEQQFLAVLADRLGISPDLRAHVDAAARGMA